MLRSGTARTAPDDERGQQSLGELVSLALKDVSALVQHEIRLAKKELTFDAKRAAIGGVFVALILFVMYPLFLMLLFAGAYGLHSHTFGQPIWAGFLWMALLVFLILGGSALFAAISFKKITGVSLTRKTVAADIAMIKQRKPSGNEDAPAVAEGADRTAVTAGSLSG